MIVEHTLKLNGVNNFFLKKEMVFIKNLIKNYKIENMRKY
jgi:hypothetical protein